MIRITVVSQASGESVHFDACADEPLLDQLERESPFKIPNLCWMGACGTCALKVSEGIEHLDLDAFGVGATTHAQPGFIQPCVAGACERATLADDPFHVLVEVA